MYVEDLVQTFVDPVLAVSVFVSSYILCSIDLAYLVMLSSTHSGSYTLSSSASVELLELQVKKFDGDVTFTLLELFVSRSHSLCND